MAGFGDNSTAGIFQRSASLGTGLRLETGEWTSGSTTDISIPTTFTQIISYVSDAGGDGSCYLTEVAEISGDVISGTAANTTSGKTITYIAFGW